MTINKFDSREIAVLTTDALRTRMQHRSVELSGEHYEEVLNYVQGVVSNYVDNKHVLNKQLNPHTGVVEEVNEPATQS